MFCVFSFKVLIFFRNFQEVSESEEEYFEETIEANFPVSFNVDVTPPEVNEEDIKSIHLSRGLRDLNDLFEESIPRFSKKFKPLISEILTKENVRVLNDLDVPTNVKNIFDEELTQRVTKKAHYLGPLNIKCKICGAKFFKS